ncbi:MSMEG_0565 family glycosyltransferase [Kribbella jiaozuonensis]|uniref:MSMEG_0565 family glycosyltransferase n=1 Tax=Kribbella jiaozuonensis TaxID=2575441 RepID=A0A4U3LHD3_9ACTN|nr:MSMEG_0565 family glycosyltransferase [Kribbella jiaozuonensis]TKK74389.1 MSMEG_0565 family glycosyltransferase [Kribbella jiaozuonensis]
MRIALLSYSTKPRGGVVHTLYLAEALAAAGADVTVWSLARGGDEGFFRPVDPRVRLSLVPFPDRPGEGVGERILRSIAVLRDAFDGSQYDVVHAQDCISANAAGRCIRTVHHLDHFTTPELAACHERAIVDPYAHVCVSAAVADELLSGWGLKATVIPNGVDATRFTTAASDAPSAKARRDGWRSRLGRYVLTVGGIEPRKGSLDLLEAYARMTAAGASGRLTSAEPSSSSAAAASGLAERTTVAAGDDDRRLQLVIAGGETLFDYRSYRAAWDERAAQLGVAPVVLGPVDDVDLPALVAGAEVFAFPSVKEGFGLAPLEALAAGVPLVVSDLPVFRGIFGDAATYATGPAALAQALRDALTDRSRADLGRKVAATYTWTAAAEAHLDLYELLLRNTNQRNAQYM